jgi:hypothetical protein
MAMGLEKIGMTGLLDYIVLRRRDRKKRGVFNRWFQEGDAGSAGEGLEMGR